MRYMPYDFHPDDAFRFAREQGLEAKQRGDELKFKLCPYCKGGGSRDRDSFAINLNTGQFKCLRDGCGVKGNMIKLSQDFNFSLGNEVGEYYRPVKKFKTYRAPDEPIEPKPRVIKYLWKRGISEETAKRYEICAKREDDAVMVFMFYDPDGTTVDMIKYRRTDYDPEKHKNKEWSEKDGKPVLFGIKQCDLEHRVLTICEGQIDSISVAEAGIKNAVSVPTGSKGFTWVPYCWDWVHNFEEIIVFGDNENGHITLLEEIRTRFRTLRIKHVKEEDYRGCKDANEILQKFGKEQIRKCIENAIELPVSNTKSLADVEEVNPFDIQKLPTGLKDLDRALYGGLPFGGVTIITGKSGSGKSILASQILVSAMNAGHKVFAYSGELPNHLFKAWMTFQVAGADKVFTYSTKWGETGYNVTKENREKISEWYRGRIDIYDSTNMGEDEDESLLKTTELMICREGCDVILIDNMMTALDLEVSRENDKYERQSKFAKALTRLALSYEVLIILVAHKRKNSFGGDNTNDEVAGSSDITNLAMVTISYGKHKDLSDDERMLEVAKNRLFGTVGKWAMSYDERCKRIYGKGDSTTSDGGWETVKPDDLDIAFD